MAQLFDHLVGVREQRRRHVEAERFSCLEIDDELVFGRLNHRQVARLGALEDAASVPTGQAICIREAG
jgi:hypothetical protein